MDNIVHVEGQASYAVEVPLATKGVYTLRPTAVNSNGVASASQAASAPVLVGELAAPAVQSVSGSVGKLTLVWSPSVDVASLSLTGKRRPGAAGWAGRRPRRGCRRHHPALPLAAHLPPSAPDLHSPFRP